MEQSSACLLRAMPTALTKKWFGDRLSVTGDLDSVGTCRSPNPRNLRTEREFGRGVRADAIRQGAVLGVRSQCTMTGVLIKMGNSGTQTHRRRRPRDRDEGHVQAKEGEPHRYPLSAEEEAGATISGCGAPELEKIEFCHLSSPPHPAPARGTLFWWPRREAAQGRWNLAVT